VSIDRVPRSQTIAGLAPPVRSPESWLVSARRVPLIVATSRLQRLGLRLAWIVFHPHRELRRAWRESGWLVGLDTAEADRARIDPEDLPSASPADRDRGRRLPRG